MKLSPKVTIHVQNHHPENVHRRNSTNPKKHPADIIKYAIIFIIVFLISLFSMHMKLLITI